MLLSSARESESSKRAAKVTTEIMDLAMAPYFEECRYVQEAQVSYGHFGAQDLIPKGLQIRGSLSIPSSCYIQNTGHFNAVEFNLCFNQLGYLLFAQSIALGLMRPFSNWNDETFRRKQLPDVMIVGLESNFRRQINASRFTGTAEIHCMRKTGNNVLTKWSIKFEDEGDGSAYGDVTCFTRLLSIPNESNGAGVQ